MEGFNDLLEDIKKQGGPLMWITQKKKFLENQSNPKRTPEQLKQAVLQSNRLKHVIDSILHKQNTSTDITPSNTTKFSREDIEINAKQILDEMAHQFDMKYVRVLGYILIKVFSVIYQHIYYNSDIENNLAVLKHYPTLFLPLHRSYMDFLLVSIICYHKNIQLPAVAAGQDFLGLSFLSNVIRHTGAFFIRRSFGSDELYWALFHEYVQQHLSNCDRPVEFFIEGTRSRTSKSLQPKQGMLSTCVELFMRGHRTQDIYIIPISLTYERLLEEILYSNELLGIPKPKETVKGLVKARSILSESYGSIFINFSRPISLREVLSLIQGPKLNIKSNTLNPSFIFGLTQPQFKSIESMSYLILIDMLQNQVIQPISVISTCLLVTKQSIDLELLCHQVEKLKRILINLGVRVYWPIKICKELDQYSEINACKDLILENLNLHSNLFQIRDLEGCEDFNQNFKKSKKMCVSERKFFISLKQPHLSNKTEAGLFESASLFIALCSYKNQLVNSLVRASFVCNSLLASSAKSIETDDIQKDFDASKSLEIYKFLTCLFAKEFIFRQGDEEKDFSDSLSYLTHTNLINVREEEIQLDKFNMRQFLFFSKLFESIMSNYSQVYECLIQNFGVLEAQEGFKDEKVFVKRIQKIIFEKMMKNVELIGTRVFQFDFEVFSLNLITNSIQSLTQFGVLSRNTSTKVNEIDLSRLELLSKKLSYIIRLNRVKTNKLVKLSKSFDWKNDKDFKFDIDQDIDANKNDDLMLYDYEIWKNFNLKSKI